MTRNPKQIFPSCFRSLADRSPKMEISGKWWGQILSSGLNQD
jgi:hypothetical protein